MALDPEQRGIVRNSLWAVLIAVSASAGAYLWVPSATFGLDPAWDAGERLAFALKCDFLIFLWLAGCLRAVASGRFNTPADRKGAAYGQPTQSLAVRLALLQNSLEQTVLTVGAHLLLAALLRGPELVLIPVGVALYLVGRASFALSYPKGAAARAFGMALTAAPSLIGLFLAGVLLLAGR